jgi:CO/xanthine dehydrogenase FAD-binding subunit
MISSIPVTSASTLSEAYSVLATSGPGLRVLAGGTDLMVQLNARLGLESIRHVLDIWNLEELRGIKRREGGLSIGALTTYSELIESSLVREFFPAIADVSREIGAWAIQNRGTLGGNVCNASPAGDTLPLLLAADAIFVVGGPRGERLVAACDFFVGYRRTALAVDELLLQVELPIFAERRTDKLIYRKVGTRRAQSISRTILAARASATRGVLSGVRVAAGCVAPTPIRCKTVEAALEGKKLDVETLRDARRALDTDIQPISDVRGSAEYRCRATANVLEQLLKALAEVG